MSYSDEAVKAKLSALNESQDSIVSVAQWIMFHRRHADRTASIWLSRLQESNTSKRLNLIYLANEVVQQSRARNKSDFLLAFEPLISDATATAYKSSSQELQGKIRRVVEVWRQRNIFDPSIQTSTERRLDELDKLRGVQAHGANGSGGRKLGGSLFGGNAGSVPGELEALAKTQAGLNKVDAGVKPAVDKANVEYSKYTDPDTPIPTAPLHAAKLSALMKNLATAQGAVEASIKTRKDLLTELEKLVESNRAKLAEDETTMTDIVTRKESIENKKKEVEDNIMRGLSAPTSPENSTPDPFNNGHANGTRVESSEIERPEAEGFTPPPPDVESFTPPPTQLPGNSEGTNDASETTPFFPEFNPGFTTTTDAEPIQEQAPQYTEPSLTHEPPPAMLSEASVAAAAANDFLNNLSVGVGIGQVRQASAEIPTSTDPRLKRRKMSHPHGGVGAGDAEEDVFGLGSVGGVDEEGISALLGQ